MRIIDSQLTLGSKHALEETSVKTATLERVRPSGQAQAFGSVFQEELDKRLAARVDQGPVFQLTAVRSTAERVHDMVETMIAMLFGHQDGGGPVALSGDNGRGNFAQEWARLGPPRASWQITQTEQVTTSESCQFAASGKVCLADGSHRQFDVGFKLERREEITRTASRALLDPLVLDRSAPRAVPAANSVEFDLDSDGSLERLRLPGDDSAFLFLDRNRNGLADNGSELFGPESGNGFAELALLDGDRNGWIDSGDAAFADIKLWQPGATEEVRSLAEAGIGALATLSAETPFDLKDNGERVGRMRSSSVWLGQTDGAGIVRQVDLSTTPLTPTTPKTA